MRIVVVAGEPSGDRLGAQLALLFKQQFPNLEIEGVFGREMIKAGCLQLHSMDTLAVMGLIDPILSLPQILKLRRWLIRYILENPPDLFIGIDAPDFNLGLEKVLHKAGITTVHYVSPSVWAWRQGRIKTIKSSVDLMLTLFPFEAKFYEQHKVPVCYTGHPTADLIPIVTDKSSAKHALGFTDDQTVLVVMPGSRNSEMKHMTPLYLETIKRVLIEKPDLQVVIPLVQPAYEAYVEFWKQKIIPDLNIKYVIEDSYAALRAADFALVTSGTATLEVMLHKVPMLVAFKTNLVTYEIVKRLIKVKYIALPNLIANYALVPEYIQKAANPKALAAGLLELMNNPTLQYKQTSKFNELHKSLQNGASQTALDAINKLVDFSDSVIPEMA